MKKRMEDYKYKYRYQREYTFMRGKKMRRDIRSIWKE